MESDKKNTEKTATKAVDEAATLTDGANPTTDAPKELNGPKGPEPTRYGDWEQKGRCSDF